MTDAVNVGKFCRGWGVPVALIVGGLAGFAAVAADVVFHGRLQRWDLPLARFIFEHSQAGVLIVCSAFSALGEVVVIVSVATVVGVALAVRRRWRSLLAWVAALAGSGVINPVLKSFFRVPRPEKFTLYAFELHPGYSFPSGHTMAVSITAGALALVLMRNFAMSSRRRWLVGGLVGLVSVMEAFALLYVGVHYLTDVLGGLAVSAAWLGVVRWMLPPAVGARVVNDAVRP